MPHKIASSSYDDCEKADDCLCVDCKGKTRANGTKWSPCDYLQYCSKVGEINKQLNRDDDAISSGELVRTTTNTDAIDKARKAATAAFKRSWEAAIKAGPGFVPTPVRKAHFYHDCAYEDAKKGADISGFQADHVHELQLGGDIAGHFKWMTGHVNGSFGTLVKKIDPSKHKGLVTNCCPP